MVYRLELYWKEFLFYFSIFNLYSPECQQSKKDVTLMRNKRCLLSLKPCNPWFSRDIIKIQKSKIATTIKVLPPTDKDLFKTNIFASFQRDGFIRFEIRAKYNFLI